MGLSAATRPFGEIVRTLKKAIDILHVVAGREAITAREVASALQLSKSATHRILATLDEVGLVQRTIAGNEFALGPLITALGGGQVSRQRLIHLARVHIEGLRDQCSETVGIHVLQGDRRVLLDQAESQHEHRWVYKNPGVPMPLHAGAASKMLLAMLPEAQSMTILKRNKLVSFTANTPHNLDGLKAELRRIRSRRCAISLQEVTPGISSIAVPIDTAQDSLKAVMSITGPHVRLTTTALEQLLPALRQVAVDISRDLHGATPRSRMERPRRTGRAAQSVP